MAIHVYMSTGKVGASVDASAKMNYRGEAGPNDDPVRFRARMQALGYRVELVSERVGDEVVPAKRDGAPQLPPSATLSKFLMEA